MINVPVTVTTYAIDVTVAQNAINVGVSVVTKTIAVTVNYGLSSTQVDAKIQEHREETNAHLSSSISYGDGTVEEVLNSRFLGVDEGSNIEIDDTNPQRPIVAVKASPEFADTLMTGLKSDAGAGGEVPDIDYNWFKSVYAALVDGSVKSWIIGLVNQVKSLASRVGLLEDDIIIAITTTENVTSILIDKDKNGDNLNICDDKTIIFDIEAYMLDANDVAALGRIAVRINENSGNVYYRLNAASTYFAAILGNYNYHKWQLEITCFANEYHGKTIQIAGVDNLTPTVSSIVPAYTIGINQSVITSITIFPVVSAKIKAGAKITIRKK